jgi:hypothetical protein
MEKTWAVDTAQARAMTREGWTDFSMTMTVEQVIKAKNIQIRGDAATWHRRFAVASVGATVAAAAILGSLILTSYDQASAAAPISAAAVSAGFGFDDPPAPPNPNDMPMDMPGMDMGGSSPEPTIPAEMPPDMPGMDMTGDSHGASASRPLAPVLGTFGGATSAVFFAAGLMRRKDRAASLVKKAARIAGRAKK